MDTDRDLLFGVLARKADLIDADQLSAASGTLAADPARSLADTLVSQGLISQADREFLEREVSRKLGKHGGNLAETLAAETDAETHHWTSAASSPGLQPTLDAAELARDAHPRHMLISNVSPADEETRQRYTLTRLHAKGGIGQVWLARDTDLGRDVALKELRPERGEHPVIWSRFLQEARITGQLEHPSIVPVYELALGAGDQKPFYTMRFVRGYTLNQAITAYHNKRAAGKAGPLDLRALLNAFVAVCNAVAYAHSRGVVHRDLKGQNVVLGDFGEVMVLDWGLAKILGEADQPHAQPVDVESDGTLGATLEGQAMGTPAYMPPEQAEGRVAEMDRRSDVYALGAMLFEILAGKPPFTGSNTTEVLHKVVHELPEIPRKFNPQVPLALEAICLRAMAKRPADRFSEATDLAREVQRWMADEPVESYREPWTVRLGRWTRKHKTAVSAAGGLLVTAVIALAVGTVLIGQERDEARRQRAQARTAVDDMYTQVAQKWLEDRLDPLQREFLEKALAYYERFSTQEAADPVLRQERARAFERVGDILRKLGRHDDAEKAYRQAIEIFGRLTIDDPDQSSHREDLATTETRLALALSARGQFKEAEALYLRAEGIEDSLVKSSPSVRSYGLELGQTKRNLADYLRVNSRAREAEREYRQAIDLLEGLAKASPGWVECLQELAAAHDFYGLLLYEGGRHAEAATHYRRAVEINEQIATDQPLLPMPRETLAKSLTSLGMFLINTGRSKETVEPVLRRALDVNAKLAADFPLRPEFKRDLARSHVNLGLLFKNTNRLSDSEKEYREAIALDEKLTTDSPTILQYRLDLARTRINLGEVLGLTGRRDQAEPLYREAIKLYEQLAADNPTVATYKEGLCVALRHLGELLSATGRRDEAEDAYRRSIDLAEPLARENPDKPEYKKDMARSLNNLGILLRRANKLDEAEKAFRQAVELNEDLTHTFPGVPDYQLSFGNSLNSLAGLKRPGAVDAYHRAISVFRQLAADSPKSASYRQLQAVALNNLGEIEQAEGHTDEAERCYNEAIGLLRRLVNQSADVPDYRSRLGYVLANMGWLRLKQKKTDEALRFLQEAVDLQKQALETNSRSAVYRLSLIEHLQRLARAQLAATDDRAAAQSAAESIKLAQSSAEVALEALRILSACLTAAQGNEQLPAEEREARVRSYSAEALKLAQSLIARGGKSADAWKADPELAALRARPEFAKLNTAKTD